MTVRIPRPDVANQNRGACIMKTRILTIAMLMLVSSSAFAIDLATQITKTGNTVLLESVGYAKLNLIKEKISLSGPIAATGTLSVKGTANIVMWVKVEGRYYFSKLPALQKVKDAKGLSFNIPFNASDKVATEVMIEVEMLSGGRVSLSDLMLQNR